MDIKLSAESENEVITYSLFLVEVVVTVTSLFTNLLFGFGFSWTILF